MRLVIVSVELAYLLPLVPVSAGPGSDGEKEDQGLVKRWLLQPDLGRVLLPEHL